MEYVDKGMYTEGNILCKMILFTYNEVVLIFFNRDVWMISNLYLNSDKSSDIRETVGAKQKTFAITHPMASLANLPTNDFWESRKS